eukprot:1421221-Amphidinium_carterae.1
MSSGTSESGSDIVTLRLTYSHRGRIASSLVRSCSSSSSTSHSLHKFQVCSHDHLEHDTCMLGLRPNRRVKGTGVLGRLG